MKFKEYNYYMKVTEYENNHTDIYCTRWFEVNYKTNQFKVLKEDGPHEFPESRGLWQKMSPSSMFLAGAKWIEYDIMTEGDIMVELI